MERENETRAVGRSVLSNVILVTAIVVVAAIAVVFLMFFRGAGEYVEVSVDGEVVARYSLGIDGEYSLSDGRNVLVISGGAAYMAHADCPDKTCVSVGRVSRVGETIICLPNRVAVTVVGAGASDGGVDVVS